MADLFSRTQAKRLFGFIYAGGTLGGILGPASAIFLAVCNGTTFVRTISTAALLAL